MSDPKYWGPTVLITGAPKSGKKSFARLLTAAPYDTYSRNVDTNIGKKKVRMNIIYASPETMGMWYNTEVEVCLVLLDLTAGDGLQVIPDIVKGTRDVIDPKIKTYLIGNKFDDVQNRKISEADARSFAQENNMSYHEVSVLCNVNVEETFEIIKHENSQYILRTGCSIM